MKFLLNYMKIYDYFKQIILVSECILLLNLIDDLGFKQLIKLIIYHYIKLHININAEHEQLVSNFENIKDNLNFDEMINFLNNNEFTTLNYHLNNYCWLGYFIKNNYQFVFDSFILEYNNKNLSEKKEYLKLFIIKMYTNIIFEMILDKLNYCYKKINLNSNLSFNDFLENYKISLNNLLDYIKSLNQSYNETYAEFII